MNTIQGPMFGVMMVCMLLIVMSPAVVFMIQDLLKRRNQKRTKARKLEDAKVKARRLSLRPLLSNAEKLEGKGDPWDEKLSNGLKLSIFSEILDNPRLIRNVRCIVCTNEGSYEVDCSQSDVNASYGTNDTVTMTLKPVEVGKNGYVGDTYYIYAGVLLKTHSVDISVSEGYKLNLKYSVKLGGPV